jgi:tetratricopeptide (TPR) repeat protein
MRYFPWLIQQAGDVHPEALTIPLLFFKGRFSLEDQAQLEANFKNAHGPDALNEWTHGDLISVQMLGMIHPEFNSLSQRSEIYWETDFLDAYLKHDASAMAFLKRSPDDNEVPKHVLNVSFRAASPLPFTFADFRMQVGRESFDHISDVYAATHQQQPGFSLGADELMAWAYRLFEDHHSADAIDVLQFAVQLQPSSVTFCSLGEIYERTGQRGPAIENYKKALAIDPGNILAKMYLAAAEKRSGS